MEIRRKKSKFQIALQKWNDEASKEVDRKKDKKKERPNIRSLYRDPTEVNLQNKDYESKIILIDTPAIYGFDKIELVSKVEATVLREKLQPLRPLSPPLVNSCFVKEIDEAKREMKKYKRHKYNDAYKKGFRSIIRIICPSLEFFDLMIKNEHLFGQFKPWIIEICKNVLFDTEEEAIKASLDYFSVTYRKYTNHNKLYTDNFAEYSKKYGERAKNYWDHFDRRKEKNSGYLGEHTLYLGDKDLVFVNYPRESKLANKTPCVHFEWRLMGNQISKLGVRKKGKGMSYFTSLKNLSGSKIAKYFEKLSENRIRYAEINKIAVAKRLTSVSDKKKFTKGEEFSLLSTYDQFKIAYDIETTADFVNYARKYWGDERGYVLQCSFMS